MNGSFESDPRTALASERTSLARFRVSLALDRTTLPWIRTALTFATFGFGMIGFFRALLGAERAGGANASWSHSDGSGPGDYRAIGNGAVLDLSMDIASQATPRRADQRVSMAPEYCDRRTRFGSRTVRALVFLR